MSTLSFREQAAIAYVSSSRVVSPEGAVIVAQKLADEGCKAWGHDVLVMHSADGGDCNRCGAHINPEPIK